MQATVERAMAVRQRIGDDSFFDLHYQSLVADPLGQIKALYEWASTDLTTAVEREMTRWLGQNPQGKHGVSTYSLDEYALTRKELQPVFDRYLAAYDVALDPIA